MQDLTPREKEILGYIVMGKANKQIAYSLGISLFSVTNHVKRLLKKMEAENRTHAAVMAIRLDLVGKGEVK